jgi:hypothetical protein
MRICVSLCACFGGGGQKYFNDHIFRMEQEDYRREEIAWVPVTYADNEDCLRLLYKARAQPTPLLRDATHSTAHLALTVHAPLSW